MDENNPEIPQIPITLPPGFDVGEKLGLFDLILPFTEKFKEDYYFIMSDKFKSNIYSYGFGIIADEFRKGNYAIYGFAAIATIGAVLLFQVLFNPVPSQPKKKEIEPEDEPDPPRDFTIDQLKDYNGIVEKKLYIGLAGEVYDVSGASNFYGPGEPYNCFCGRDATRAMAKLCFDEEELSNPATSDLGPFERDALEGWVSKFKYVKVYPIVGRLSYPIINRRFTIEDLAGCNGTREVPSDRINSEILVGLCGKVYDVSYGGVELYGPGGPYHLFAGKDASVALAKMSFLPEDVASTDISSLTPEQKQTLQEWDEKFLSKRKYPVVGTIIGSNTSGNEALKQ